MSDNGPQSPDTSVDDRRWRRIYCSVLIFFLFVLAGLQAFSSFYTPS